MIPRRKTFLLAILLTAALVRSWAALRLPLAEGERLMALADATALRDGGLPALAERAAGQGGSLPVGLLYGLEGLALGEGTAWPVAVYAGRLLSAALGVAAVLLLALLDPLAGGLLALHTLAVAATGRLSGDALALLTALLAVLALQRAKHSRDWKFWLSAPALGATAAHTPAALPLLPALLTLARREKKATRSDLVFYSVLALLACILLRPALWRAAWPPYPRIAAPQLWTQTLLLLGRSLPAQRHPDAFLYPAPDALILLLALPGLYREWHGRRWVVIWAVSGLLFLPVWPGGGQQNILLLLPPLCLAASATVRFLLARLREHETYWHWLRQMVPAPPLAFWLLAGALLTAFVVGYTAFTLELTLGRLGWSHLTAENSPLPDNTVYALAPADAGRMMLATGGGVALWSPPPAADRPARWQVWTQDNAPLPAERVRAVLRDGEGAWWFGTDAGPVRYDGARWRAFRAADLGLKGERVHALALGEDGRVWVGTEGGVAFWDGAAWTPLPGAEGVYALAVEGNRVWIGTGKGLSRLDTTTGLEAHFAGFAAGVSALLVEGEGRVWAGTMGDGLGLWDGQGWRFYRPGGDGLPHGFVTALAAAGPGAIWVGTAHPTEVGGTLSRFDGQRWEHLTPTNSGFSAAEPLAITWDGVGSWWIGTRTAGVDILRR